MNFPPRFRRKIGKNRMLWHDMTNTTSQSHDTMVLDTKKLKQTHKPRNRNGNSIPRFGARVQQRDFEINEIRFPSSDIERHPRAELHTTHQFEIESDFDVNSSSPDYEPTPKRGYYRFDKQDTETAFGPHPASIGRFESSFQESANFKTPESFENSERKLQSWNSTIGDGRKPLCDHNAVDCSYCQLFFRAEKRDAANSREQRLQQLLHRILSCDPRESSKLKVQLPPVKGIAKEEEDFLTPMLLSTAYLDQRQKPKHRSNQAHLRQMHESCDRFNPTQSVIDSTKPRARSYFRGSLEQVRTEELLTEQFHVLQTEQLHLQQSEQLRASSQFLLSMLAENLALNLSDVDFTNMTLKLRRHRMSYTKTFVKAATAAGDSLLRSSRLETDTIDREHSAEPKRLRPILNFV